MHVGEQAEEPQLDIPALKAELGRAIKPQFQILDLLGVGGMGAVFLAREAALKRLVAVKIMEPSLAADRKARVRFEREATAAAQLSHPNVVRVYSIGETKKQRLPYIVMQHVDGATLAAWMTDRGKVTEREARRIIGEVAAALAAAHRRALVHRDVKPSNVLLEKDSGRAYVADFGVSAALTPEQDATRLTGTGVVIGTPVYMSPEQASGAPITPKSDIYSLGILAYELVTGQLPFTAASAMGWVAAHIRDTPTPVATKRPDLSPEVLRLIDRCLSKEPTDRPTADEVARGMLPSLESEIEWPPPGLRQLAQRFRGLERVVGYTAGAGFLLLLMLVLTPDILEVHGNWLARFSVPDQLEGIQLESPAVTSDRGEVSFFLWQTGLIVGAVVFAVGAIGAAISGTRLLRGLNRLRRVGWDRLTLSDVFADHDGRSGLLLAGAREFASMSADDRRAVLGARRRWRALVFGALVVFTVTVAAWMLMVMLGVGASPSPTPLAGRLTHLVVALPALLLVVAGAIVRRREMRLLGPLAGRRRGGDVMEVSEWYRTLPRADARQPAPAEGRPARWRRIAWNAVVVAALIVITVGAAEILLASLVAARFVQTTGPRTAELVARLDTLAREQPVASARAAWRPLLPAVVALSDPMTRTLLQGLAGRDLTTSADTLPGYAPEDVDRFPTDSLLGVAMRRALAQQMPADSVVRLAELEWHPRTQAFRRLALTDSFDLLVAGLDRPLDAYANDRWIPIPQVRALREAARVNMITAVAAVARGDRAAAERRLGENAAFAEKLLAEPSLVNNLLGLRILQREVLDPAAQLASAYGEESGAARYRQAVELINLHFHSTRGAPGLAADPTHYDALYRVLGNEATLPGLRAEILVNGSGGICGNPAEILNGPSTLRRERQDYAAKVADIRHGEELVALGLRMWESPIGSFASGEAFADRGWLERTPIATALRILACLIGPT
jgi:tRNA A-37 threonylcarbamoyl transferase component Bud32